MSDSKKSVNDGEERKVIIVGAGIAGLSLAIQLSEKKIPVVVVEARTHFDGLTSGVRISSQGVRILKKMGIYDVGEKTEHLVMYFGDQHINFKIKNSTPENAAIIVTRLAIFEKLRQRIDELGIEVIYGSKLSGFFENNDGVVATSSDGKTVAGAYLVGADGVGSVVRTILNPGTNSGKHYAGYLGIGWIFPDDAKVEMSLFNNIHGNIGVGSIGSMSQNDTKKNLFMWTHLHMAEEEAKLMTREKVIAQLTVKSQHWTPYLKSLFQKSVNDPQTVFYFNPVYNRKVPDRWYSVRTFLIGDAAHPYGPGGQGISMALKDAEALCELLAGEMSAEGKERFQVVRATEAKDKGESSEERNKPENQIASSWQLFLKALAMKAYHWWSGGKMEI
jgi:2-polyprenyl-6-methoxyphenol hydroxylase-like FAD-dependent oxidoreductase